MQTNFATLTTSNTLAEAVKVMLDGSQHDFPVVWGDTVMGILTRTNLLAGLQQFGPDEPVTKAMQREFATAEPNEMLEAVLTRLSGAPIRTMPVMQNGNMIGLVTLENLGEYLMVQNALQRRNTSKPPSALPVSK